MLYVLPSNSPHALISSTLGVSVQSRNSQSYEPLLLENEREAVADLLQYLESACFRSTGRLSTLPYPFQKTGRQPTFSPALHSTR